MSLEVDVSCQIAVLFLDRPEDKFDNLEEIISKLPLPNKQKNFIMSIALDIVTEHFERFIEPEIIYKLPNEC